MRPSDRFTLAGITPPPGHLCWSDRSRPSRPMAGTSRSARCWRATRRSSWWMRRQERPQSHESGRCTSPKWSPDGKWISFDRTLERSCEIVRVPAP